MKKSSTPTSKTKESRLGAFLRGSFLRSSTSSQSVHSKTSHTTNNNNNKKVKALVSTSNERQGRERTPRSTSSPSLPTQSNNESKTMSEGTRRTGKSLSRSNHNSNSSSISKNSDLRLRSKSPSRQRIEKFMEEVRARERSRSGSRERQLNTSHKEVSPRISRTNSQRASSKERHRSSSKDSSSRTSSSCHRRSQLSRSEQTRSSSSSLQRGSSQQRLQQFLESRSTKGSKHGSPSKDDDNIDSSSEEESVDGKSFFSSGTKSTGMSKSSSYNRSPPNGNGIVSMQQPKRSSSLSDGHVLRNSPINKGISPGKYVGGISPISTLVHPSTSSDDPQAWFDAIGRHEWIAVEQLIRSYDYKRYRQNDSTPRKPQKKLRVLKYLPSKDRKNPNEEQVEYSPLLFGDAHGRTPLHLACKEFMPWKLLQSLFFLERNAVLITDDDERLPLHLALIANHDTRVLDRLIHAHPDSLLCPDKLARTPMGYAILRADHKRDKSMPMTWRKPMNQKEWDWQTQQVENWENVEFLLETFVARRKLLSKKHEQSLLMETVDALAPPSIVNNMLSVSARILQKDQSMAVRLFQMIVRLDYPITVIQKALKICLETMPQFVLMSTIRQGLNEHYERGCIPCYREDLRQERSFRVDLLHASKQKQGGGNGGWVLGDACQEWWDKLKFLIGFSSSASLKMHTLDETYLLHSTLKIPDSSPGLVEFLIRLMPKVRFEADPETDAMPIHLACQYWNDYGNRNYERSMEAAVVLKMIVRGDASQPRNRHHRRYPLHTAILARQSWRFIQTILSLDTRILSAPDPWTRLYPFQLAAMTTFCGTTNPALVTKTTTADSEENRKLDMIYQLLRMNPVAVNPVLSCGSGSLNGDLGLVAQHVLSWCYVYKNKNWVLNRSRLEALRGAISKGSIPETKSIKTWFAQLKTLIWKVYDQKNAGKRIAYMPHDDIYLLHAALSNGETPPIAIELLLELSPKSIMTPIPGTDEYPIHIAANGPSYNPMPFETIVSMTSTLEMIILASPQKIDIQSNGRNILQIAIQSGKNWHDLRPIIQQYPVLLQRRDPVTGLLPFQQVACIESFVSLHEWMQAKTFATKWTDRTPTENGLMIRKLRREYQDDKTNTIYEMLHAYPHALETRLAMRRRAKF